MIHTSENGIQSWGGGREGGGTSWENANSNATFFVIIGNL